MTPENCRAIAEAADNECRQLANRYGDGTRPAWVGEEIGILQARARRYRAQADAQTQGEPDPCPR